MENERCKQFLKHMRKLVKAKPHEKIDKRCKPYLAPNDKYYEAHCGYCAEVNYLLEIYDEEVEKPLSSSGKERHFALVPCADHVDLCEFDGTFDEGEGVSMGEPITWKDPKNATSLRTVALLSKYDDEPLEVLAEVFRMQPHINKIYLGGVPELTGWYERGDVI